MRARPSGPWHRRFNRQAEREGPEHEDVLPSPKQHSEEIGVTNFVQATSPDPTTITDVVPGLEITEPSMTE